MQTISSIALLLWELLKKRGSKSAIIDKILAISAPRQKLKNLVGNFLALIWGVLYAKFQSSSFETGEVVWDWWAGVL